MVRLLSVAAVCVAACLGTSAVALDRPLQSELPPDADACYARTYDEAHLTKNPAQTIVTIKVDWFPSAYGPTDVEEGEWIYTRLTATLRGQQGSVEAGGICESDGKALRCRVDCDGGAYVLESSKTPNALIVRNLGVTFGACNGDTAKRVTVKATADDGVFRLDKQLPSRCVAPKPAG